MAAHARLKNEFTVTKSAIISGHGSFHVLAPCSHIFSVLFCIVIFPRLGNGELINMLLVYLFVYLACVSFYFINFLFM